MSGGGSLPAGEKSLPPLAADAVSWDCPLPALRSGPSSGSLVQVTRGGGGGLGLCCVVGCLPSAALGLGDAGTALLNWPAAEPQARGDYTWRGVCERVRACGCVCVWLWRASRPAWGGGPRRGGGRAISRGRARRRARGSGLGHLARGPIAAAGQIVIFVFPGRVPLPGLSSPAGPVFEKEIVFQLSFTQRKCSLHLWCSLPFPKP